MKAFLTSKALSATFTPYCAESVYEWTKRHLIAYLEIIRKVIRLIINGTAAAGSRTRAAQERMSGFIRSCISLVICASLVRWRSSSVVVTHGCSGSRCEQLRLQECIYERWLIEELGIGISRTCATCYVFFCSAAVPVLLFWVFHIHSERIGCTFRIASLIKC